MQGKDTGTSLHLDGMTAKTPYPGLLAQNHNHQHTTRPLGSLELGAKPLRAACFCLGRLFFPVSGLRVGFKRGEKTAGNGGYFLHGFKKYRFVGLRRLVERLLIFLTYCREAARISSGVTGGSKLNNILIFRHMNGPQSYPDNLTGH